MPMIREAIVTTVNAAGAVHIAPLGLIADGEEWIIAPFHPSTTLDNLRAVPFAVANYTDAWSSNQFGRRTVEVGQSENGTTQVLSGLAPGDKIAGNGSLFLQFANSFQH